MELPGASLLHEMTHHVVGTSAILVLPYFCFQQLSHTEGDYTNLL